MRSKLCLFVGIALIFLSGCGSESTSKKFDSAINEVISLENKRLEREKLFREKDVLKREDTGIIVYSDGKYIELIYTIDSTQQIESMFEYNEKENRYTTIPYDKKKLDKIQKDLNKTSYTENIGLK